jgi:hypothetical protein
MAGMSGDPIAGYLTELRAGLRTPPARTAEIVAEAEDHLRESAAAVRQAGHLSETAAQQAAIEAFGPVRRIVRAHRPPVTAVAAAAGLRAWPLLGWYLLLSALVGWIEVSSFTPTGEKLVAWMPPTGQAVKFGTYMLLGAMAIAGFLIVRQRRRRFDAGSARLPRGLFPLAAAIGFIGIAAFLLITMRQLSWRSWWVQLDFSGAAVAILASVGCVLWTAISLVRLALTSGRGTRERTPPEGTDIATVG